MDPVKPFVLIMATLAGCGFLKQQFGDQAAEGFDNWLHNYDYKYRELASNEKFCPAYNTENNLLGNNLSAAFEGAVVYANGQALVLQPVEKEFFLKYDQEKYRQSKDFIGSEEVAYFVEMIPAEQISDPNVHFILAGHAEYNMDQYGAPPVSEISEEYNRLAYRNNKNNLQVASDRANLAKKMLVGRGVSESRIQIVNHGSKYDKQALDFKICGAEHVLALDTSPDQPSSTL